MGRPCAVSVPSQAVDKADVDRSVGAVVPYFDSVWERRNVPELVRDGLDWSVAGVDRVLNEAASLLVPCSWSVTDASEMARDWFPPPFKMALTSLIWEMLLRRARKGAKAAHGHAAMGHSLSDDVDPICVRGWAVQGPPQFWGPCGG